VGLIGYIKIIPSRLTAASQPKARLVRQ
jgi:hypothetical protein